MADDLKHTSNPDHPLTSSASWLGITVGTLVTVNDRGNRLIGMAALNYDSSTGALVTRFTGIRNIDHEAAPSVETVIFFDLAVEADGTFQ
ncbi:MAG: hypothetical protein F4Y04_04365 [Chloroflexi bacterium]|nr:hypothetical protein [Chloroflexota bacterium]